MNSKFLSEKVFIMPSFLKYMFIKYGILDSHLLSFIISKMWFHCFIVCCWEVSCQSCCLFEGYLWFSLLLLRFFSFSLIFSSFAMICLGMVWVYPVWLFQCMLLLSGILDPHVLAALVALLSLQITIFRVFCPAFIIVLNYSVIVRSGNAYSF